MNMTQLIDQVNRKSRYSAKRQAIIEEINSASRRVYNWIIKETPGKYFLKWDTSLSLAIGTQEYALQPDLRQLVRIREFDPDSNRWRIIHSTDFNDISRMQGQFPNFYPSEDTTDSIFNFYGPYEKDDGNLYLTIEPDIDRARQLEIVYDAHFVEIQAETDYYMIPEDARDVVRDWAVAELLGDVDDDATERIDARGQRKLTEYLEIQRRLQIQDSPRQEPYLD